MISGLLHLFIVADRIIGQKRILEVDGKKKHKAAIIAKCVGFYMITCFFYNCFSLKSVGFKVLCFHN